MSQLVTKGVVPNHVYDHDNDHDHDHDRDQPNRKVHGKKEIINSLRHIWAGAEKK